MQCFKRIRLISALIFISFGFTISNVFSEVIEKKSPAPGVEYRLYRVPSAAGFGNGSSIHILRIDPSRVRLRLLAASEYDKKLRTTAEWCREFRLVAAINAGMFLKDYLTNVGYLRNGALVQNGKWNGKYRSVFAFEPRKAGIPQAILIDLDEPGAKEKVENYAVVVQNLRLMKSEGVNVWEKSDKRWSEAAVGIDRDGRIVFIFCGTPVPMWKFNELISSLGLGIVRMMHMEGGPLASLSVSGNGMDLNLAGGYETGAPDSSNANSAQLPLPNVIGVQSR